ncbi:hypothetical protein [Planotetraspora kaengkrachanensis]|uniref:Uncharacterized protein n=1 Tax=Planotetraspora kaengkrachanensis TaxID=575193 RepID=A0A8J3M646_9ACTN|nr:hypothetical protein [Planotetraspora kaengkrachanensis]GIG80050.1 hypothetical protein Pka01_31770 [Planotetraspora kaengkrachanensis]
MTYALPSLVPPLVKGLPSRPDDENLRDLFDALTAEFDEERPELVEALTYCDMTTGPDGTHLDVAERLAEIHSRYGPKHLVSRSITASTPCILAAVRAVERALASSGT